ncbi:MAG: Histidinol-phosphate aminotransferase, partial [uncultured Acidimicrobiales bacterium]
DFGPRRPGRAGGLPLGPGHRRRPPQHQRVALPAAAGLAGGVPGRAGHHAVPQVPRPGGPGSADRHRRAARSRPGAGPGRQRVERGHPGPVPGLRRPGPHCRRLRAHLRPALPHPPHHRHGGGGGGAARRLLPRPGRGGAGRDGGAARHHLPVLAQQPHRPHRRARGRRSRAGRRSRTGAGRRGVRPVRVVVGPRDDVRRPAAGRHPDLLQDLVDGRLPARVPGRPRARRRRRRAGHAPVPPRRAHPDRRPPRPAVHCRHGGPGGAARVRARAPGRRPGRPSGRHVAVGRQLPALPPPRHRRPDRVEGPGRALGPGPRLLVVAPPRRLPPGHRRHPRRGRCLPHRAQRGPEL